MASPSTLTARLPATLTRDETPLAIFFDATGTLAFGKSWPKKPVALLQRDASFVQAGTPEAYVRDFYDDVLAACCAGVIETCFSASVRRKRHQLPPSLPTTVREVINLQLNPDVRDSPWGAPQSEHFAVQSAFWADACLVRNVDWSTSNAKVPKKYVLWDTPQSARVSKATIPRVARQTDFDIPEVFDCVLNVRGPARAAQLFLSQIFVPSDDWARRYRLHRNPFMKELLICGWRYLAISHPKPEHGTITQIENEMREYIKREGLLQESVDGSEMKATLNNLASNLYQQWCEKALSQSALINSKRATRKSSRASTPNKRQKPNKPT